MLQGFKRSCLKDSRLILTIILLLCTACAAHKTALTPTPTPAPSPTDTPQRYGRGRSDFGFLKAGMDYEEVVSRVGPADRDIGSGLYILVYELNDGSEIYLSFVSLRHLEAATIEYPSGMHENLVEPRVQP